MRPQQQNRRMRGRNNNNNNNNNRKGGPNPLTRSYESNGPDVKIRGNAQQIADKYMQLARDAQGSGDRVMAENYLQHAEHYNRIIAAAQAQMPMQASRDNRDDMDDDEDGAFDGQSAFEQASVNDGTGPQPDIGPMAADAGAEAGEAAGEPPREARHSNGNGRDGEDADDERADGGDEQGVLDRGRTSVAGDGQTEPVHGGPRGGSQGSVLPEKRSDGPADHSAGEP